jgi:sigma54-dependent transcription regulator
MLRMPQFSSGQQRAADALARDLDQIFGARLRSLVVYPGRQGDGSVHTMALIDKLAFRDLVACLPFTESWHHRGAAVPLLLTPEELQRTIDIFPLEYAGILGDYAVVRGTDPLRGVRIDVEDIRRACETQAKSHLIHLRESFLESHGETTRVARLIAASAAPLRALLTSIARLPEASAQAGGSPALPNLSDEALATFSEDRMHVSAAVIRDVLATSAQGHSAITDPSHLLARYIDGAEKIWAYVDRWSLTTPE